MNRLLCTALLTCTLAVAPAFAQADSSARTSNENPAAASAGRQTQGTDNLAKPDRSPVGDNAKPGEPGRNAVNDVQRGQAELGTGGGNWGLIGLLGLFGLFGLAGRGKARTAEVELRDQRDIRRVA